MKHLPDDLRRATSEAARAATASWPDYESQKRDWIAAHPVATSDEYERAMRDIVKELRL